jgi:hypothetical protein
VTENEYLNTELELEFVVFIRPHFVVKLSVGVAELNSSGLSGCGMDARTSGMLLPHLKVFTHAYG